MSLRKYIVQSAILTGLFLVTTITADAASRFTVAPLLIDHTTEGRDIITDTITLKNLEDRNTRVYASVHEIMLGEGDQIKEFVPASMSDGKTSITSWIEISRARIELPPLGEYELPLTVRIHPNTEPGTYHAFIGFASGANRDEIEKTILSGLGSGVLLKITIDDKRRELLQVISYTTDRLVVRPDGTNELNYSLQNNGDLPLTPKGEVIIYNNRGAEVATVPINSSGQSIAPGEVHDFTEPLPFLSRLGKHKAYLAIEYGTKQTASVFDTTYYYSVPWYYVLGIFVFLTLVFMVFVLLLRRFMKHGANHGSDGVHDVPLFVREVKDHDEYDHDINLKNK
jgi:hypothetical protein